MTRTDLTTFTFLEADFFDAPLVGVGTVRSSATGETLANLSAILTIAVKSDYQAAWQPSLSEPWPINSAFCTTVHLALSANGAIEYTLLSGTANLDSRFQSLVTWQPTLEPFSFSLPNFIATLSLPVTTPTNAFDSHRIIETLDITTQTIAQLNPSGSVERENSLVLIFARPYPYIPPNYDAVHFEWVESDYTPVYVGGDALALPNAISAGLTANHPQTNAPILTSTAEFQFNAPVAQNALTNKKQPLLGFVVEWQYCPTFAIHTTEYDTDRFYTLNTATYCSVGESHHRTTYESNFPFAIHENTWQSTAYAIHANTYQSQAIQHVSQLHEAGYASTGLNAVDQIHHATYASTGLSPVFTLHEAAYQSAGMTFVAVIHESDWSSAIRTKVNTVHEASYASVWLNTVFTHHALTWSSAIRVRVANQHETHYASIGLNTVAQIHEHGWASVGLNPVASQHDLAWSSWIRTAALNYHEAAYARVGTNFSIALHENTYQSIGLSFVAGIHEALWSSFVRIPGYTVHEVTWGSVGTSLVLSVQEAAWSSVGLATVQALHETRYASLSRNAALAQHECGWSFTPTAKAVQEATYKAIVGALAEHRANYASADTLVPMAVHEARWRSFALTPTTLSGFFYVEVP